MGSNEVTCACTPHFTCNHLLPFDSSQKSLGAFGLVENIFQA